MNKMFKKLVALVSASVLMLSACGDGGTEGEVTVPPADVTKAVLEQVSVSSAVEKGKDDLADFYTELDVEAVDSASFYICASGAYPDEIAVIRFSSASDVEAGKAALQARLDKQIELFTTYTPDEMYKLDTAQVFTSGNYAVLLACADNEKAKSVVTEMLS